MLMGRRQEMFQVGNMVAAVMRNRTMGVWQVDRNHSEMRWTLLPTADSGASALVTKDLLGKGCRVRVSMRDIVQHDVRVPDTDAAWQTAENLLVNVMLQD